MSSIDATFHAAHDLIYALHHPEPAIPLVKLGNGNKQALRTLVKIFRKANPSTVPSRVSVREVVQDKLQEVNQERSQIKVHPDQIYLPMQNL